MNTEDRDEKLEDSIRALIFGPFLVLLAGLLVTGIATWTVRVETVARDRERFAEQVHYQKQLLDTRIENYEIALNGLRDLFYGRQAVTRGEWELKVFWMDPRVNLRGLCELGYAHFISGGVGSKLPDEVMKGAVLPLTNGPMRLDLMPGYRRYAVLFDGGRHMRLHQDYGSELHPTPEDRAARNEAVNKGTVAFTPRLELYQDGSGKPVHGFRVYLGNYLPSLSDAWGGLRFPVSQADTSGLHSSNFKGFLHASIEADEFLRGIFGDQPREVEFQWFSATTCDEAQWLNPGSSRRPVAHAFYVHEQELNWYGQKWRLRFYTTERFHAASFRNQAWWVAGIGLVLSFSLAGLFQGQVKERIKAEDNARRLALATAQLQISQEERAALGRDLHDGAIQSLYAVTLHLERLGRVAQKTPEALREAVSTPEGLVRDVIRDLRLLLAGDLSSVDLESTLESGLEKLTGGFPGSSEAGLRLSGAIPGATRWPVEFRFHVLQMAREALSNAVRHSGASSIRVDCSELPDKTALIAVRDNGRGFDPASAEAAGHGLRNLRLRAAQIGATVEILSTIGSGTELLIRVPPPRTLPSA